MSKKIAIIFSVIALVWAWLYISKLTAKQIEKAYRVQENMYNQARQNMQEILKCSACRKSVDINKDRGAWSTGQIAICGKCADEYINYKGGLKNTQLHYSESDELMKKATPIPGENSLLLKTCKIKENMYRRER